MVYSIRWGVVVVIAQVFGGVSRRRLGDRVFGDVVFGG